MPALALAADDKPKIDTGDTAWMLTSTALVLMMTIPGLALFYGGMVRKKNVLATIAQSFAIVCLVTVLWLILGYSLAFTRGQHGAGRREPRLHGGPRRRQHARISPRRSPNRSTCVPADLRDHHAGADRRRLRRAHEVLGHAVVHRPVVAGGLRADRPLGVGRRLPRRLGRARLRRRHGGAHQCRRRRPGLRAWCSASAAASAPRTWRRTISSCR